MEGFRYPVGKGGVGFRRGFDEYGRSVWGDANTVLRMVDTIHGVAQRKAVVRGMFSALLWLMFLAPSACGYKNPPRSQEDRIPEAGAIYTRQRADEVIVYWKKPGAEASHQFKGIRAYVLLMEQVSPQCLSCEPLAVATLALESARIQGIAMESAPGKPNSRVLEKGELQEIGGWVYYLMDAPKPTTDKGTGLLMRIRMAVEYGIGQSAFNKPVLLQPRVTIPRGELSWESLTGGVSTVQALLLSWKAPLERVETILGVGTPPREIKRYYRGNIYRRQQGQPWPLIPLNPRPVEEGAWMLSAEPSMAESMEYALRLVDGLGAEGEMSNAIRPFEGNEAKGKESRP